MWRMHCSVTWAALLRCCQAAAPFAAATLSPQDHGSWWKLTASWRKRASWHVVLGAKTGRWANQHQKRESVESDVRGSIWDFVICPCWFLTVGATASIPFCLHCLECRSREPERCGFTWLLERRLGRLDLAITDDYHTAL